MATDRLFRSSRGTSSFRFDADVADVFLDMIGRSVPGYWEVSRITAQMAATHLVPGTRFYDLGASLLTATLETARLTAGVDAELIAVDNSEAMIEGARKRLASQPDSRIRLRRADIVDTAIDRASVVVMNWTLQFLDPRERQGLVDRIHAGMVPGGILIVSEKVDTGGPGEFLHDTHIRHKRFNGYSAEEVENKLESLRGVMIPDTVETHLGRLEQAGFETVHPWFRCLNWVSLAAIR